MQCSSPILTKARSNLTYQVRCGQCLECRIAKKDDFSLRCRLEGTSAITSSFWTLTYSEDSLPENMPQIRKHVRTFFNSLRRSEKRGGNPNMIRFFGCSEFGGKFGRPHVHLLIWNLLVNYREAQSYYPGFPRPQIHIPQWLHGHCDVAQFNTATINYVTGYMTDFLNPEQQPLMFSTRRPGIGSFGLYKLGELLARKSPVLQSMPTSFMVGTRRYSIGRWTKGQLLYAYKMAGGKIKIPETTLEGWKLTRDEQSSIIANTPDWLKARQIQKVQRFVQEIETSFAKDEQREQYATAIYRAQNIQGPTNSLGSGGRP